MYEQQIQPVGGLAAELGGEAIVYLAEQKQPIRRQVGLGHGLRSQHGRRDGGRQVGHVPTSLAVLRNHPLKSPFEFAKMDHRVGLW
jgi:hypothetical protein